MGQLINVSPTTLSLPGLSLWLNEQCVKYNVKNNNITLEITESVEYFETNESIENIKQLKGSGFGLSIDDFGTGFSSLSRLKSIPFTELKIDKIDQTVPPSLPELIRYKKVMILLPYHKWYRQRQTDPSESGSLILLYHAGGP